MTIFGVGLWNKNPLFVEIGIDPLVNLLINSYNIGYMAARLLIKDIILDFKLSTPREICTELGQRLKKQRLSQNIKQEELAGRAGVSVGTVKNLEGKGQSSLSSLVRIVVALDLVQELGSLFELKVQTIADLERLEKFRSKKVPRRAR